MYALAEITKSVPGEQPAGRDLSLTGELLELETMAKPVLPTNTDGKRIADDFSELEPDWAKLGARCEQLLRVSRDLHVAAFYLAALLRVHGFAGLAHGLELIRKLMSTSDFKPYPQTEAKDSGAYIERWYALVAVSCPYKQEGDLLRIVEGIRNIPLAKIEGLSCRYKDVIAARQQVGGEDTATVERIRNEWKLSPTEERAEAISSLKLALDATAEIEALLVAQTPEEYAPVGGNPRPLHVLASELKSLLEFISSSVPQLQTVPSVVGEARPAVSGEFHSRSEAIRVLTQIAEYFRKTEPASPVPYFIDRAVRLVDRNFMSLLGDLVPDAVSRFQTLAGVEDSKTN